jgi:hypothetical protein
MVSANQLGEYMNIENQAEEIELETEAPETEMVEDVEEEEVIVSIGEESPPHEEESQPAPQWVKELRKSHREQQRLIRELEAKLSTAEPKRPPLGNKPKLEDFDYDTDKFEGALENWYERKRAVDAETAKAKAAEEEAARSWQARLDEYGKAKSALRVRDYEDAEATTQEALSEVQQGILLQGADNPALVVYAIGKNPKRAKELAAISDPVKFAFAVAKLEKELKVTTRKPPPPPESPVKSSGRTAGTVDNQLDRLRAEALKTGDLSKVLAYKRAKQK